VARVAYENLGFGELLGAGFFGQVFKGGAITSKQTNKQKQNKCLERRRPTILIGCVRACVRLVFPHGQASWMSGLLPSSGWCAVVSGTAARRSFSSTKPQFFGSALCSALCSLLCSVDLTLFLVQWTGPPQHPQVHRRFHLAQGRALHRDWCDCVTLSYLLHTK